MGIERKLYYRELVARFGHHNALIWNLCEEYDARQFNLGSERIKGFADYVAAVDPYDHPITVHNANDLPQAWIPFLGDPRFSSTSLQHHPKEGQTGFISHKDLVEVFRIQSVAAGRAIPVNLDEFDRAGAVDDESRIEQQRISGFVRLRKAVLWPVYLSGGQIEFILEERLKTENFHRYAGIWRYTSYARRFLEEHLPFWAMEPADGLIAGAAPDFGGAQVFIRRGEIYAVYLPKGTPSGVLDLRATNGVFIKRWYDPRHGTFKGAAEEVKAGSAVALGEPPGAPADDWAVLLRKLR